MNKDHESIAAFGTKSYVKHELMDLLFITLGISSYAFGYTAFILPEKFVMGGVSGISALLYYAFDIPTAISIWVLNITLLLIGFRALNKQFTIRTIIGVTILSLVIGVMQPFFAHHLVITVGEDRFMHVLIGGILGGAGLGIVFSHNGSTGGTDIIVAWLNKKFSLSFGRAMQFIDYHHQFVVPAIPQYRNHHLWYRFYAHSQRHVRLHHQWYQADGAIPYHFQEIRADC